MSYIKHVSMYDTHKPNYKIRHDLIRQGNRLEDELKIKIEEVESNNSLTYEEQDQIIDELDKTYSKNFMALYTKAWMLEAEEVKNDWFINVFCKSFTDGRHNITQKQMDIFARYCRSNEETFKSGEYYCIANNRHIALNTKRMTVLLTTIQ